MKFTVAAETLILFVSSLIWPMIDSYYISLLYTLSMLENKSIEASVIVKRIQWLAEALFEEKVIFYYESCNIESIKNAVQTFKEMGVIKQKSVFLALNEKYKSNEDVLMMLLDQINEYRIRPNVQEALLSRGLPHKNESLRRQLMADFPFMAKL